jgi:hypothetical protein
MEHELSRFVESVDWTRVSLMRNRYYQKKKRKNALIGHENVPRGTNSKSAYAEKRFLYYGEKNGKARCSYYGEQKSVFIGS